MPHILHREQTINLPLVEVFSFFSDAGNLEKITPPQLRFRILTPRPIKMEEGALIDYRLSLHGLPFKWRTLITRWEPPYCFTDEQLRGPYALWRHTHMFYEIEGQTVMTDKVEYQLPFQPFGEMALPIVRKQINGIFDYRSQVLSEYLEGKTPARPDQNRSLFESPTSR